MKLPVYFRFILALALIISWAGELAASGNPAVTTIYVVRHGEKMTANPTDKDPELSPEGQARAKALAELLKGKKVDALYSTNYKRTRNTLQPLAEAYKLTVNTYEPQGLAGLKQQILEKYAGKTVVVAGHSNTILSIVEALGAKKPVAEVPDSKYDHLFKVTIAADGTATLEASTYGAVTN
ncbi:histidine phosphatase family protein [Pontibacter sp. H259]|uniref:SixA phosphatase family protein n=1 Tax=Pontibacter sp. H259 TaxID=3133421 RepID=UPI0030C298A7